MALPAKPTRVVVIGEAGASQQQVVSTLSNQPEFELVEVLDDPDRMLRELQAAEADLILLDYQLGEKPTLDQIDDLATLFPDAAIIAILPAEDAVLAQQVLLAGAQAFIIQPFTQMNLLSTLRRVRDLQARRRKAQPAGPAGDGDSARPLRTLVVFSPRGGAGCTTIAANLAIALYEATNARVLLMEGKLFFGHLDVMLNIRTRNSLADLIPHASSLDDGLVREVTIEHASGIRVLLAPNDLQIAQGIRPQDLFTVVNGLQRYFDYLVIDAGSSLTENTVTLMDAADRILLITTPDLAGLHDVSRFGRISQTLAYTREKVLLVLNRAGRQGGIKTHDIESVLRQNLFAQIPDDPVNALRSLNRGIPLLINYPRSQASRSFQTLANSISALNKPRPSPSQSPEGKATLNAQATPATK